MAMEKAKTIYGMVQGEAVTETVTAFKGIPYAKAPIGTRRFQAPCEPEAWSGCLECRTFAPMCIQNVDNLKYEAKTSEDSLYLNVYTPAVDETEKLPVMVWIYGGAFREGGSTDPEFDGTALAQKGVVLVTFNYRCGPLGFFFNEELEKVYHAVPNAGIYDQLCALNWVNKNINFFGGNPENVTVFGQSAGGISARIHLTTGRAKGLIAKAIIQSGGGLNEADLMRPKEEFQKICDEILKKLGWSTEDLFTKDAEEINARLTETAKECMNGFELAFFQPFLDDELIKEYPGVRIERGDYEDVPVMVGSVCGDSWMFSRKIVKKLLEAGNTSYYSGFAKSPGQAWAQSQAKAGKSPMYTYYFELKQPENTGFAHKPHFGAETPHASDIPYVFGTLDAGNGYHDRDYEVSDRMRTYWSNFAKTGNPNGDGNGEWPAYTAQNPMTMHFTDEYVRAENIIENEDEQKVIDFIKKHPGMTVTAEGLL